MANNELYCIENWFQDKIRQTSNEIEKMAPNLKAIERLERVEDQYKTSSTSFENARKDAKNARDQFKKV
jgi:structural maintenance of chromosome 1